MARACTLVLRDHLTAESLRAALADAERELATHDEKAALLVDVTAMTGYESEARTLFVAWNDAHRDRVVAVAIVTTNSLWVMVIAAMSLASQQKMKSFSTFPLAASWCASL